MKNGFSVLEVILAVAIFLIFSTGAVITVIQGYNSNRLGTENTVANQFAAEGIEAVKSIKNRAYTNLTNFNAVGLNRNSPGNYWEFKTEGTNNTLVHNTADNYIRTIKVENVNRDAGGNIVSSGGTPDPDTKKVSSSVTWNFNSARPETTTLISYLSDWRKPISGGGPVMMAYSKTTATPFYRIWNGSVWGVEGSAQAVGGNINYIVLKSSRTRNEAVLGTLDANGNIYAQVWNGTVWSTPTLMASIGAANSTTRSFDIDYEKSSDRAVIAYLPNSTSADFTFRYWDGSTWSAPATVTAPPTTGVIKWIDVAQNPGASSNEIAMILFDANSDIYGMAWNGTAWVNMGDGAVWDATASTSIAKKATAVAYEQTSGRAMFIWARSTTTNQNYRIWNGITLTSAATLTIAASGGIGEWVKLVSRPNSNELMYGVQDAGADLNTMKWSGSAWDTVTQHPEHDATLENITSMNFDLVWETHTANPGEAWILWGDGAFISKRQWSGSAWGAISTITGSDDTSFIRLKANPGSGEIFAGIYEDSTSATDDIWESRLTGGGTVWSAKNTIWGGPTSATPVFFRIDISAP